MIRQKVLLALAVALMLPITSTAADHLALNPHLNYKKNNHQGPLITGDHMMETIKTGMPNYIVFYAEFCYNAKRQARTTVQLYQEYKDRVHFVIIDFEYGWSAAQDLLVQKYFAGKIPQIVILDAKGRPVFNYIGQTPETSLEGWLKATLEYPASLAAAPHPMDTPREITDTTSLRFTPVRKILKKF
ncbi:MAG: thioredoxin domain-containing protein [Terriglobia bacterium]